MKSRIRIVVSLVMLVLVLGVVAGIALRPDEYHTPERRAAKARMIQEIGHQVAELDPGKEIEGGDWWDGKLIRFRDGSWIAYRAQCQKADPKVHDIFIGKGSDGAWYYSTYHFCVGMLMLQGEEQMDSLVDFISDYALEGFDGVSDQALLPTWPKSHSEP